MLFRPSRVGAIFSTAFNSGFDSGATFSIAACAGSAWATGQKHSQERRAAWFLGSDHNFAAMRSVAPNGRAAGSGNLCSDPENARIRFRSRSSVRAEVSKPCFAPSTAPFDQFWCRSVAAAGDSLFLVRQNKVSQKKATLLSASLRFAAGNLRCLVQPGSSSNSLRSNNRSPLSVWTSAPRRIQKGLEVRNSGSIEPASRAQ